jgi:predicted nucleic acid-binding protein
VIFVDTSFWVALRLRRDARHDAAAALVGQHDTSPLVTSNHVRGETWTFLRARGGHRDGVAFLDMVERTPRLQIAFVDEPLEREAVHWLRRHDERGYSFVDATSFALMRSLGIREALAFDGDFAAAGFVELRPGR